jgi:hypothetical protein
MTHPPQGDHHSASDTSKSDDNQGKSDDNQGKSDDNQGRNADYSVWVIWGGVMLIAIAILPFAARSRDVANAIARMCGFELG